MLAGVITRQPMGARDSQTRSDDVTLLPPRLWIPVRSVGMLLLSLQKRLFVHQLQQPQLLLYTVKIKTTTTKKKPPPESKRILHI